MSSYAKIITLGPNAGDSAINSPWSYCLNTELTNGFLHGSSANTVDLNSPNCINFTAQYCAEGWDEYCEAASLRQESLPPNTNLINGENPYIYATTMGEYLLRNSFSEKYLVEVINGKKEYYPFDPTVATSPMISKWTYDYTGNPGNMVFVYDVNPQLIDSCPLMAKILAVPNIASDILLSIYNKRFRENTLYQLKGTNLGNFYELNQKPI